MSAMHFCSISANVSHSWAFMLLLHIMPWRWNLEEGMEKSSYPVYVFNKLSSLVVNTEANEMWLYVLKQDCLSIHLHPCFNHIVHGFRGKSQECGRNVDCRMQCIPWLQLLLYSPSHLVRVPEITCLFSRSKWRHWHKVEFHPVNAWAAVLTTQYHNKHSVMQHKDSGKEGELWAEISQWHCLS